MADPMSPSPDQAPLPAFSGADTLLDTLDDIVDDPEWFQQRNAWPLIRITSDPPRHNLLRPLAAHYRAATPTAWVDGASGFPREGSVDADGDHGNGGGANDVQNSPAVRLLDVLADTLRTGKPRIRARAFRRFDFVRWLIGLRLDSHGNSRRREARTRHRRYLAGDRSIEAMSGVLPAGSWWSLPLRAITTVTLFIAYTVIVRLMPHYRWLGRQPYLNYPTASGDVLALVIRAATASGEEDRRDLERLLVHAFLTDLERRSPQRWWPPRRRRRTRQPVLLFVDNLRGATDGSHDLSGPKQLLQLIAAVRRRTGTPDPVVLLLSEPATSDVTPPEASVDLAESDPGRPLDSWRTQHAATDPAERTWLLRLTVPPDLPSGQSNHDLQAQITARRPPTPGDLPTWAVATASAAALAILLGGVGFWWYGQVQDRCGVLFPSDDTVLERHGKHCLGVTDLSDHIFQPPRTQVLQDVEDRRESAAEHDDLRRAQERIREYNSQVEASGLPYLTVVYFGAIADRRASGASVAAPRSELEGLALAQAKRIDDVENASIPSKRPLLRVLVANAGPGMKQAPRVARILDELYRENLNEKHPIVAMVGLGQSVVEVEEAMQILEHTGMPMVGSITSYDGLPDASQNYFQVGPNNERMAQVAAYFAERRFPDITNLLVIRSNAQNDTYSRNLADDVENEFRKAFANVGGLTVDTVAYETGSKRSGPSHARVADRICGHDGLVFYAGRAQDLGSIATELEDCVQAGSIPEIMAGDDVSRTVLQGALDGTGLTLFYVPMATSATSGSGSCTADRTQAWTSLFERNDALFGGTCPDFSDGRKLLIYDAVDVVLEATDTITDRTDDMSAVSAPAVRTALEQIHGKNAINGFSGVIDFGKIRDNRVPVNKTVSVLKISSGDESPELMLRCGPLHIGDTSHPEGCPR